MQGAEAAACRVDGARVRSHGRAERPFALRGPAQGAVTGLFLLALIFAVVAGRPLLLPLMLSGLASALLAPVVALLQRCRIPRSVGALLVVVGLVVLVSTAVWRLSRPAVEWIESAPRRLEHVEERLSVLRRPIAKVSEAAERVGEIARMEPAVRAQQVVVRSPSLGDVAFARAGRFMVQLITMLALLYFLLAAREPMLVRLAGFLPFGSDEDRSSVARRVRGEMSRYLLTATVINLGLGLAVAGAMELVGLPNPLLWGAMAALLNYVPYVGAFAGVAILAVAALTSIDNVGRALLAPGLYLFLNAIEGLFLTPAVMGHRMQLNPVAVLVSVMLWGWFWGIPGALLAVPILAGAKVVIDASPGLERIGALLER
jgi:predicted PurR-regulated permease PerM